MWLQRGSFLSCAVDQQATLHLLLLVMQQGTGSSLNVCRADPAKSLGTKLTGGSAGVSVAWASDHKSYLERPDEHELHL